ncbi:DNA polymerase III subunit delta [Alistipes sp. OttesenSCG-928-B03]|nr:DNA polymerase III subunit delta [Alistipes sp. OttesenSCG-928-B03]
MAKGAIGFKESAAAFRQMAADIKARRFAPVYLLMGEEPYFIDRLADMLAENVLNDAEKAFNQIVVYGKDTEAEAVVEFARQMPMMGNYKVVIVREAQQLRKPEPLGIYAKLPSPNTVLVLCHKEKKVDKRSPLYKHSAQNGVVFESVRPRDYEIGPWLGEFIRSKGCTIEPKAMNMLVDHLGVEIDKISNELTKLLTSLPEGTKAITAEHIERNIGISKDFNNFELTKAISSRDMERALLIADHFRHNGNPKWYGSTMSVIFTHFQRIFILNYQRWLSAKRGVAMPNDAELTRMLKLNAAFFLTEYKQAAAIYPNKKVFAILGFLREYDMKGKGMNSGGADHGELLRELLLKIFMI